MLHSLVVVSSLSLSMAEVIVDYNAFGLRVNGYWWVNFDHQIPTAELMLNKYGMDGVKEQLKYALLVILMHAAIVVIVVFVVCVVFAAIVGRFSVVVAVCVVIAVIVVVMVLSLLLVRVMLLVLLSVCCC